MVAPRIVSSLCTLFFCLAACPALVTAETLTFGVVPQQSATKLVRLWSPVLSYLNQQTGYTLQFKTAPNIPEFEQRLAAGEYDIAYMNPYHYVVMHQDPGYLAIAKQKDKLIRGIIVVNKNSRYQTLQDLRNQKLAFPSPLAFAASILPRTELKRQKIKFSSRYVASHDSVYRAVALGLFPAGGGIERTFNNVDANVRNKLRILWTSKSYTPHAFAAHPRLDKQIVAKIQAAMIALEQTKRGHHLLGHLNFKGIAAASDREWNDVRALNIDIDN